MWGFKLRKNEKLIKLPSPAGFLYIFPPKSSFIIDSALFYSLDLNFG